MSDEPAARLPRLGATALLLALLMLTAGCATVMSGNRQQVHFDTRPSGATVIVGEERIQTPGDLNLLRKHTYDVVFEKPGYVTARRRIAHKTNGAFYGNALLGGIVGMVIDMSTGAIYNLEPSVFTVRLIEDPAYAGEVGPAAPRDPARDGPSAAPPEVEEAGKSP